MKILIMVGNLPISGQKAAGVAVTVQRIAVELSQRSECEVTIGCLAGKQPDEKVQIWYPMGTGLLSRWCRSPLGTYFLYPLLLNFIKFPQADVVHFHGEDWFYVKRRQFAIMRTMHGASKREREFTQNPLRKLQLRVGSVLERLSAAFAHRLLCVGSDTQKIFGSPHYIGNGYSSDVFYPSEKELHPVVFYNGYWKGRKRGDLAYQTFVDEVLPRVPEAELWFLGDNCPPHPKVKVFRGVTDKILGELYRRAWVFLYPSSYEGFGMAYVEAMASGTVVVASPNSGAADVLCDGEAGLIVPDEELGNRVVEILEDSSLRRDWEAKGLERAQSFTIETIVDEHLRHYKEVMSGG